MRIRFIEPRREKRTGGLEAAIGGLATALPTRDVAIMRDEGDGCTADSADIFHFHGLWEPRFAKIGRELRKAGKPYIISPHGMLEPWAWRHKAWKKWPYFYLVELGFLRGAATLLSTAPSEAAAIAKLVPGAPIATLPLGLTGDSSPNYAQARGQLGWKSNERVLLFLSRLHVKKGLDLLLEALRELRCGSDVRLVIAGGGDPAYVNSLRSFIVRHRNSLPRIDWIGEVWGEARWPYFQGADLFCLPSYSENFGLAVLDALQVGTPVLTTNATPWLNYLSRGQGLIAEPAVTSIRESLSQFLAEPAVSEHCRSKIADWARQTFHWSVIISQYRSLYERALVRAASRYCAA